MYSQIVFKLKGTHTTTQANFSWVHGRTCVCWHPPSGSHSPTQLYESRQKRGTLEQSAARERTRQVAQVQKVQKLEEQCQYCKSSEWYPFCLCVWDVDREWRKNRRRRSWRSSANTASWVSGTHFVCVFEMLIRSDTSSEGADAGGAVPVLQIVWVVPILLVCLRCWKGVAHVQKAQKLEEQCQCCKLG